MRAAAFVALCLLLGGCVTAYPSHPPVPPPLAEEVPAPPQSPVSLIWQPGHFDWTGGGYVWTPGVWVDRAGHGTLWQDGYWREANGGFAWVSGHWM